MTRRGAAAEALAAEFLERRGLKILARNFRCRGGEIDLVCADGRTLVFVEVRLRTNQNFGGAAYSITPLKQRRLVLAARHYLARHSGAPSRFDAVLLGDLAPERIEWIRNAFDAS